MSQIEADRSWTGIVKPEWTDYNGHLNVRYFLWIFDEATHIWYADLKLGQPYREETNHTTFAVQCHLTYQREGREGDQLAIDARVLGYDEKRLHYFLTLHNVDGGYQMATFEQLALHVNLDGGRKVTAWPDYIMESLEQRFSQHSQLELPPQVGLTMDVKGDRSVLRSS